MMSRISQSEPINVLLSNANWAWPQAVRELFQPRGINALMADSAKDILRLISTEKIHLAILDTSLNDVPGVQALGMIRRHNRSLPCILLAEKATDQLLSSALALNAFCVITKPIDMGLLAHQVHRLFTRYYASNLFTTDMVIRSVNIFRNVPRQTGANASGKELETQ